MKELLIATPSKSKTGLARRYALGKSFKGWKTVTAPWTELHQRGSLPDVTMVLMKATATGADLKKFLKELALKQEGTHTPSYIVLCFVGAKRPASSKVAEILRGFHRPEQVEVRWSSKPSNIDGVLVEIEPKLEILREVEAAKPELLPPRHSPLDQLENVLVATRDLRVANGNISAQRIADLCGVSLSELSNWLGRSRQAVNKTPDADALQPMLAFFERVARLRLRVSDDDFRKWLRVPNELLEGKRPIELLASGQWQVLADFVDDMLTGSPT
jgi:hypothetical protein